MIEIKTYEIVTSEGRLRMDIPEDWKVTFGPIAIGAKSGYGGSPLALRVYESETKQRAIFTNVLSFRDLSIPVQRLKVRREGQTNWEDDNGNSKYSESTTLERKWVRDDE